MGRLVEDLSGRYIVADDMGTTLADLVVMREVTRHTAATTAAAQQPLSATAFGVFSALGAAAEVCLGRHDLEGLRVAVQGLGNVGMPLCGYLAAAGAALVVSDLDLDRCEQAAIAYGATVVEPEAIYTQDLDVFAPGGAWRGAERCDHPSTALPHRLRRCQQPACGDSARRGVGGVRHCVRAGLPGECRGRYRLRSRKDRRSTRRGAVARIGAITRDVLRRASETGATPLSVADAIVRARIRRV
jgi:hypothetical protein